MSKMPNATEIAVKEGKINALYEALEIARNCKSVEEVVKEIEKLIESKK